MTMLPSNKFSGTLAFLLLLLLIYDYGPKAFPRLSPTKNVQANTSYNLLTSLGVLYVLAYNVLLLWTLSHQDQWPVLFGWCD